MRKIVLAGAAAVLLAAVPAFAQQTQSERAASVPGAGTSGRVGVTTDGVVPNPPAVNGSGPVTSDSTGAATTSATTPRQATDQRGQPRRAQSAPSSESTTSVGGSTSAGGALPANAGASAGSGASSGAR